MLLDQLAKLRIVDHVHGNRRVAPETAVELRIDQIEGANADVCERPPGPDEMHLLTNRECETEERNDAIFKETTRYHSRQQTEVTQALPF